MRPHPPKLTESTAIALTSLALSLGVAGCGNGAPQASPSQTTSATTTTVAPTGTSAARTTSVTPGGTGSGRCHASDLKADLQIQKNGSAMAILTNTSSRTCTVTGYLSYHGLLADNSTMAVTTKHVANPGPPVPITLKRGISAFSGVKWTSCDKAETTCTVLAGLRVTPPEDTAQLTATILGTDAKPLQQLTVTASGFTAGSLQPASQGVLFP